MDTYTTWTKTSPAYAAYLAASQRCATAFTPGPKAALKAWNHPRTGETRHYVNNVPELIGLDVSRYGTGNISSASLGDHGISNSQAYKILNDITKVYVTFDTAGKPSIWLNRDFSNRVIDRDDVTAAIRAAL